MVTLTLEEIIDLWKGSKEADYSPESAVFLKIILRALSNGKPISSDYIAKTMGVSHETAVETFVNLQKSGADFDDDGDLTGLTLTLLSTPHELHVNGNKLYAWCALDALFLPGLIEKNAEIVSTCPATGIEIRLTLSPESLLSVEPEGVVLSIVVPGYSAACQSDHEGGAQGPVCSSMHFFNSRKSAETWLIGQPDVAILTLEEAWQLAQEVWVKPFNRLAGEMPQKKMLL